MKVRDVMTPNPVTLESSAPVMDAAQAMSQHKIGDVVVRKNGKLCGIVTDRDIVIRVVGEGRDPNKTELDSICSHEIVTVSPGQNTSDAVKLMRERAVRRLPVVENNHVLGIVSLGDLALAMDRRSALGDISAAPPSQ